MLLQAGIKKISYLRNYHNDPYAMELIKMKNVELNQVTLDEEMIKRASFETYLTDHQ